MSRTRGRARVLFLTCHLPFPAWSGGRRREYELIERLAEHFEIELCAVTKTLAQDREHLLAAQRTCAAVNLFGALEQRGAVAAPQVARHGCPAASAHLRRALGGGCEYDLVHVEGFYLMQHLPPQCPVPVLLAEQNVEHLLWRQRAQACLDERRRAALRRHARATRAAERDAWLRAALVASVTEEDRAAILADAPSVEVEVVPDGWDHSSALRRRAAASDGRASGGAFRGHTAAPGEPAGSVVFGAPTVVVVGNHGYEPSLDAALWMCLEIFPRVRREVPDASLLLVGASPPPALHDAARACGNVTITGLVEAVEPYLQRATVVACPLRVGGGVKVKMLEALGRGCAIVATPLALAGLGRDAGRAVRVAESAEDLAAALVELIRAPAARARLQRAAATFAPTLPSWDEAAAKLADCYEALLESGAERAA